MGNDTICNGDTTTLTANGGGFYLWSTGSSSNSISVSPNSNTNYNVVVTDANTCVDSSSISVVVNPLPAISISGNNTICQGGSTTLTASGGSSYLWNNGSSSSSITVSPVVDSTYIVTGTNANGCSDTSSVLVQVMTNPTATISGNDSICYGESTTLNATGGGTYTWNTGATSNSINVSPTSNTPYYVVVDVGGCIDTAFHNLSVNPLPVVNISGNTTICNGQSITLTATGGGSYVWNTGSFSDSIVVYPTSDTSYSVVVTNIYNCIDSSTANVTVNPLPNISINGDTSICLGTITSLTASGANNYIWNNSSITPVINVSPTTTTTYSVTGTDLNNCSDSAQIQVEVLPLPIAAINGSSTICFGETTTLTASGGDTYVWNTLDSTSSITLAPQDTSTYTVIVSSNGCIDSANYTIDVIPLPVISAYSDTTIIMGQSATIYAQGIPPFNWMPQDSLSCTNCVNPTATPRETTTYCVSTSENGCTDSSCVTVYVDNICGDLFVPNSFSPNGDGANDCLKVYSNCLKTVLFRVYSRWGELIFESDEIDGCWDGTNNGSDLNTGVYVFTVKATLINSDEVTLKGNVTLFK